MGFSSERFCHAAIGRLMDGDRGHWLCSVHVCAHRPHIHTYHRTRESTKQENEARRGETCRPANDVSFVRLPPSFPPTTITTSNTPTPSFIFFLSLTSSCGCVIHIQVHSAGEHASPTDIYIYIHRVSLYINTWIRVRKEREIERERHWKTRRPTSIIYGSILSLIFFRGDSFSFESSSIRTVEMVWLSFFYSTFDYATLYLIN